MTQNFTPPPDDGIKRGSGRATPIEFLPFLAFLGFIYIGLTMGQPDRPIWEQPAIAIDGKEPKPIPPMCLKDGVTTPTGQDDYTPCK